LVKGLTRSTRHFFLVYALKRPGFLAQVRILGLLISVGQVVVAGHFASGTALRLLVVALVVAIVMDYPADKPSSLSTASVGKATVLLPYFEYDFHGFPRGYNNESIANF
jgi:hypothetical protein